MPNACGIRPADVLDPVVLAVLRSRGAHSLDPRCWLPAKHEGKHWFRTESDHPFVQIIDSVDRELKANPLTGIFQKWTCAFCGARETMPNPNLIYTTGRCEECQEVTDITVAGCNFIKITQYGGSQADLKAMLDALGGSTDDDTRNDA